jgi:16S rRNA G966 N2-methylase RsmD
MKMTQYFKWKADSSKGEVFTPIELVYNILDKIPDKVWRNPNATFLDPCMGKGTFLLEIVRRLVYIYGYTEEDAKSRVYGYDIRVKYINHLTRRGLKNVRHKDFLNDIIKMEFDVVLGNPPYQEKVGPNKTESLWNKFVKKSFQVCKENGYVSLIHPNGWRNIDGKYKDVQQLIKEKNLKYLSINSVEVGQQMFNATTPFDWYVIQNTFNQRNSIIKFQDEIVKEMDISQLEIIPNFLFDEVISLFAKDDEEKVDIIFSFSNYETRKKYMSKTQSEEFQYPCVYSVLGDGSANFMYSSTNQKGHFGIPKLILGNGTNPTSLLDLNGEFGLTQFAFGIVDTIESLPQIERALKSEKFQKINKSTKYVATAGNPLVYYKIVSSFRKDFWKEFINE